MPRRSRIDAPGALHQQDIGDALSYIDISNIIYYKDRYAT